MCSNIPVFECEFSMSKRSIMALNFEGRGLVVVVVLVLVLVALVLVLVALVLVLGGVLVVRVADVF